MCIATSLLFVFVLPQNRPRKNRQCLEAALYKRKLAILPCIVLLGELPVNRNLQQERKKPCIPQKGRSPPIRPFSALGNDNSRKQAWLLKNSIFFKTARILGIENVEEN
jgi:hypothetical protein